jgi:ferredoxin
MISTIEKAYDKGKGIYIMKALAGGALIDNYNDAMNFVRSMDKYSSIAVGAVAPSEVEFNVSYFNGAACPDPVKSSKKVIVVGSLCKGCGTCMTACPNNAISFGGNNKAGIDEEKCLTCGYCTPVCPEFAIRVV